MKQRGRELECVIEDAREHGLVILAGSAISMAAPSSLPGWTDINNAFLEGMGLSITLKSQGAISLEFVEFIRERRDHHAAVPPDFQAQLAQEECGKDYFRVLQTLDAHAWNSGHGAIAALAASGLIRAIITTNFDRLIERALERAGVPFVVICGPAGFKKLRRRLRPSSGKPPLVLPVVKVHGSVERLRTMVDTLSQRILGRPEALHESIGTLFSRHAVLVVGFSGADLAYDREYLGLRSAALQTPSLTVLQRRGTEPLSAMRELVEHAGARAGFMEGELPGALEALADALAPGITRPQPEWDPEMEFPGIRSKKIERLAYDWAESIGVMRCINIVAAVCEAAGSDDAARKLLFAAADLFWTEGITDLGPQMAVSPAPNQVAAGPGLRYAATLGRLLIDIGALAPPPPPWTTSTGRSRPLLAVHYLKLAAGSGSLVGRANLARVHAYRGLGRDALRMAEEVLKDLPAKDGGPEVVDAMLALASVAALMRDWPRMLELGTRALDRSVGLGDEPRRAQACSWTARGLTELRRLDEAEAHIRDGFVPAARLQLALVGAQLAVELGRVKLARGEPDEALRHMKNGSESFGKSGHELQLTEALIPVYDAAIQCEDLGLAWAVAQRFEKRVPHMEGLYPHMLDLYVKWNVLTRETAAAATKLTIFEFLGRRCEQDWVTQAATKWRDLDRQLHAVGE